MYPAPVYRKVKHNFLSDRLLLPPFSEVGLVDYPEETGTDIPHAHDDFQMIAVPRLRASSTKFRLMR